MLILILSISNLSLPGIPSLPVVSFGRPCIELLKPVRPWTLLLLVLGSNRTCLFVRTAKNSSLVYTRSELYNKLLSWLNLPRFWPLLKGFKMFGGALGVYSML